MKTIKIKSISMTAFRGFKDTSVVEELPGSGLIGIRGKNHDTGGSSGAGKSSVAHAVAYAFGFSKIPATKQQSWLTETPMQIELLLDTPEGEVVLKRGKETSILINGVLTKGSVKAVETKIYELFGVDTDLLSALTYRPQNKPSLFLSMEDSRKKSFLSSLLGLAELEEQIEIATKKVNILIEQASSKEAILNEFSKMKPEDFCIPPDKEYSVINSHGNKVTEKTALEIVDLIEKVLIQLKAEKEEAYKADCENKVKLHSKTEQFDKECHDDLAEIVEKQKEIKNLKTQVQVIVTEKHEKLLKVIDIINGKLISADLEYNEAKKKELQELSVLKNEFKKLENVNFDIVNLNKNINEKENHIQHAKENNCPTCKQKWIQHQDYLINLESEVSELKSKLLLALEDIKRIPTLQEQINIKNDYIVNVMINQQRVDLLTSLEKINQDIEIEKQEEQKTYREKLNELDSQLYAVDAQLKSRYEHWNRKKQELYSSLNNAIGPYESQFNSFHAKIEKEECSKNEYKTLLIKINMEKRLDKERLNNYESNYTKWKEKHDSNLTEFKKIEDELKIEQDLLSFFKGFLGSIFDEVLASVSSEANEILKYLPNTATTTIEFISERVTQKNTTKQEIKPIVKRGSQILDLDDNLSGGQGTSVQIAVDLAIAKVIGNRIGVCPGFMIFDESFTGHDMVVKEACLELLQKAAGDIAIFVVDHASELKDYFNKFIDVESKNEVSWITNENTTS